MSFLIIKQRSKLQINSQNHNEKQYRRFQRYKGLKNLNQLLVYVNILLGVILLEKKL